MLTKRVQINYQIDCVDNTLMAYFTVFANEYLHVDVIMTSADREGLSFHRGGEMFLLPIVYSSFGEVLFQGCLSEKITSQILRVDRIEIYLLNCVLRERKSHFWLVFVEAVENEVQRRGQMQRLLVHLQFYLR